MAAGNFSNRFGKRPSSGVPHGRPGPGEENLRAYTGLRVAEAHYQFGAFISDLAANRIVSATAIGTPGTLPRLVTRVTQASIAAQRVNLPFPVALVALLTAAAAPLGTHILKLRVFGANQFGAPAQEDFTLSVAAGGTSSAVLGTKIFHTISAVQVIDETNTSATDAVSVYFDIKAHPKFGLPCRIRNVADILSVVFETGIIEESGSLALANLQFSDTLLYETITVDVAESAVRTNIGRLTNAPGGGGGVPENIPCALRITCRSSLGMDQGYTRPSPQKFIKAY